MATDGMNPSGKPEFKGMMLTLLVANDAEAKLLFEALRIWQKTTSRNRNVPRRVG